jgi:magnesium transporter
VIVDRAIYVEGKRADLPDSFDETYEACRQNGGMAWLGLHEPSEEEFESVAKEFGLHPLAVEDAITAHQRPKLERYGDSLFVVLRTARYVDENEAVEFGEIHLFVGRDFVVTVRHGEASSLRGVRQRLEGDTELLKRGPLAVLYVVMDSVVGGYDPVLDGLENDVDETEVEVFEGGVEPGATRRIYALSREVIQFHRATRLLVSVLERLIVEGGIVPDRELRRYLRDVHDHTLRTNDRVEGLRELLSNILNVNLAIVGVSQTDQTKRISAWAAILIVPTIVTGLYGMNFRYMLELDWRLGYPFAVLLILSVSGALYLLFKRWGWL